MTAKPRRNAQLTEQIPSVAGGLSATASAHAPFIYFDNAPNFGLRSGVASISLEAIRFTTVTDSSTVVADRVSVAHLRMSLEALRSLKAAIEGIELLASPVSGRHDH
jgi:hypothetical protein